MSLKSDLKRLTEAVRKAAAELEAATTLTALKAAAKKLVPIDAPSAFGLDLCVTVSADAVVWAVWPGAVFEIAGRLTPYRINPRV